MTLIQNIIHLDDHDIFQDGLRKCLQKQMDVSSIKQFAHPIEAIEYIEACLDICAEMGVDFFGGPMYSAVGKARMLRPAERKAEWDLAVKNLQLVCEMSAARNLKIALEPLNRFESDLVNTTDDVLRMLKDINHS